MIIDCDNKVGIVLLQDILAREFQLNDVTLTSTLDSDIVFCWVGDVLV